MVEHFNKLQQYKKTTTVVNETVKDLYFLFSLESITQFISNPYMVRIHSIYTIHMELYINVFAIYIANIRCRAYITHRLFYVVDHHTTILFCDKKYYSII